MNIFDVLQKFPGKWRETARRSFSPEELAAIKSAKVVESKYGTSACFLLHSGECSFIPMDNSSELVVGEEIDLTTAQLITLSKEGEKDIYRVLP